MRVMVFIHGNEASEQGVLPSAEYIAAMTTYNEELAKAGIMLAGEGLHPTSQAKRVKFSGGKTTVIDGPFTESKELVAGFWMWQVKDIDEAVEWAKRIPAPPDATEGEGVIEIRPIFEADDFGENLTPELRQRDAALRQQEEALRAQTEANKKR